MSTTHKWTAQSAQTTVLSTDLNSLSNAAYSAASSALDNTSNLHQWAAAELVLASLTPTGSPYIAVYLLPTQSSVYPDGGGSTAPSAENLWCVFQLSTSTSAKNRVIMGLPIPPANMKFVLYNGAGPALASSGNTLKITTYTEQDA